MTVQPPSALWFSTIDWFVDDAMKAARTFAEVFGMPEVRDDWLIADPLHGYDAVFSRAADSLTVAPSRFEFLKPHYDDSVELCAHSPYAPIADLQPRRQQVHATVLAVDDIERAAAWMAETGVAVRVEPPCEHMAFPRIWIGWDGDEKYVPGVEPGIFLEMIPAAGVSPKVVESIAAPEGRAGVSRIGWRVFLVDDLDVAVGLMRTAAALQPAVVEADARLGARTARFRFAHPGSAELVLAQANATGPAAEHLAAEGTGVWLTGLWVADPAATVAAALDRGAARATPGSVGLEDVLQHEDLPGALIAIEPYPGG